MGKIKFETVKWYFLALAIKISPRKLCRLKKSDAERVGVKPEIPPGSVPENIYLQTSKSCAGARICLTGEGYAPQWERIQNFQGAKPPKHLGFCLKKIWELEDFMPEYLENWILTKEQF